jgi:serine protease AprX
MKKYFILFLVVFVSGIAEAQDRYVVFFTDKNNSPYSVSAPLSYLSQRAITRRTTQNIPVTTLDLPVNPSYVAGVSGTGAQVLLTSKWFNSVTVRVTNPSVLTAIGNLPYVTGVLNVGRIGAPASVPSKFDMDKIRSEAPAAQRTALSPTVFNYGNSFNQVHMLKGDMMHSNGYTGAGIRIAVIDAGFMNVDQMSAFDSIFANGQILGTWDFVDNESNVYNDNQHGSMVLSCIAGNIPGELIGTAPGASFYLLRSEDAPTENIIEEYNWATAAEYADSAGADIINSSLGYTVFDDPSQNHSYNDLDGNTTPVTIAADIAASRGIIVCNSAGNEGNNPWLQISAPADADSILAVGAVDDLGVYATFSGKGPSFDGRVKPDVAAQGQSTVVADPWGLTGTFTGSGTSFASPLMAGMVATLLQCHPSASSQQIISAIRQSASQSQSPDSLLGYGIPDFPLACLMLGGIDDGIDVNQDQLILTGPNPFTENLMFSFYSSAYQDLDVRLFDILGQLVYAKSETVNGIAMHPFEITTPLAKGVYILSVTSEKSSFSLKVVKD